MKEALAVPNYVTLNVPRQIQVTTKAKTLDHDARVPTAKSGQTVIIFMKTNRKFATSVKPATMDSSASQMVPDVFKRDHASVTMANQARRNNATKKINMHVLPANVVFN